MNWIVGILLIGLLFAPVACATTAAGEPAATQPTGERVPVLVELFTSEGCSSCPPADALLAELAREQPIDGALIVPMAMHVDYWNNLGWRDPFASPAFTERQREYSVALNVRSIYTPQMIVDGRAQIVGSDRARARAAIADAAARAKPGIHIDVKPSRNQSDDEQSRDGSLELSIRIDSLESRDAQLIIAITEDDLHSAVSRGENAGRKLAHAAVVRQMRSLGRIEADRKVTEIATTIDLPRGWDRTKLRVVAFVQELESRRVIAVGSVRLMHA